MGELLCEGLKSELRDEFLNGEIFYSMKELRAGRTLARPLQHRQISLFAGLSTSGAAGLADFQHGVWRSANRYALPTRTPPAAAT